MLAGKAFRQGHGILFLVSYPRIANLIQNDGIRYSVHGIGEIISSIKSSPGLNYPLYTLYLIPYTLYPILPIFANNDQ